MADWREGADNSKSNDQSRSGDSSSRNPSDWRKGKRGESNSGKSEKTYFQEKKSGVPKNIGILNLLLLALVTLIASFVSIVGCQPTKTPMLHLATIQHEDSLWAPNAYALEDRANFTLSMLDTSSNIDLITGQGMAAGSSEQKPWIDLNALEFTSAINNYLTMTKQPGGPRPGGWIFYLSCQGVTNYDGVAYLVAKDSRALRPGKSVEETNLVPLASILQAISKHPVVQKTPESYKLLVLDMGRSESQWSANRLYNDFPSAAKALIDDLPQDIQLANTYLLLSSSDGQKSWTNPLEGGTNFGLFFGKGLMGEANQMPDSLDDDSVSLAELDAYLKKNVDNWAVQHRNSRQTPLLLAIGAQQPPSKVLLSRVGDTQFQTKSDGPSGGSGGGSQQKRLAEMWEALSFLGDIGALRLAPARFSLLEYDLTRAESMAEGGMAYQADVTQAMKGISSSLDDLATTLAQYDRAAEHRIATTDVAFFKGSGIRRDLAARHSYILGSLACWRYMNPGPITSIPTLAALQANAEKIAAEAKATPPPKEKTKPLVCQDYYASAEFLLASFTAENQQGMTPANIALILGYLETAPNCPDTPQSDGTHVVEVEFLIMLRDFMQTLETNFDIDVSSYNATGYRNAMITALQCRRRIEQLAYAPDQRVFPWLERAINEADNTRREAEDYLFALQPEKTQQLLDPLMNESTGLVAIEAKKSRLSAAYRAIDSVRMSVPYLMEWLAHHPYSNEERQTRLAQAAVALEKSHRLADLLTPLKLEGEAGPDYSRAPVPSDALIQEIEHNYSELVRFLNRESQDILDAQGGKDRSDAETLLEIENLLRVRYVAKLSSSMVTYDRNSLREKMQAILLHPLGNTNVKSLSPSPLMLGLSSFQKGPWQLALNETSGSTDYAIAPLSPDRLGNAAVLLKDCGQTARFAKDVTQQALANALSPSREIEIFPDPANATAVSAFSGVVVSDRMQIDLNRTTPPEVDYRITRKEHLAWFAHRAMEDFWGNDPVDPYFQRLARDYLAPFRQEPLNATSQLAAKVIPDLQQLREDYASWVIVDNPDEMISDTSDEIRHKMKFHFPKAIPSGLAAIDLLINQGQAISVASSSGNPQVTHTFSTQPDGIYQSERPFLQIIPMKKVEETTSTTEQVRFRGNVRRFPLEISGTKRPNSVTQIVDFNPFPFRQPTVSVSGQMKTTADVIFILDCSASMANMVEMKPPASRMNIAKQVLKDILGTMASPEGQFRVLTYAFGSRVGWDDDNDVVQRPGINVPAGIVPANDVMTLVNSELASLLNRSPQRNEPGVDVARIQDAIEQLEAFGETPLYFSIYEALQQVDPSKPTQIIVITDGANDQADDPSSTPFRKSAINLIDEFKKPKYANTQLQVVGFAMGKKAHNLETDPNSKPDANTLAEIAWLAKVKAHGGFIPADQQIELRRRIEELVQSKIYYSVQRTDDPSEPKPHAFGSIWKCEDRFEDQRHDYTVRELRTDDTAKIQLRGGEKVRLLYDDEINQMVFQEEPADEAAQAKISVQDALGYDGQYLARVLNFQAPQADSGTLEIPIRLENMNNTQFTVRPYHIWAEIQPSVTNAFKPNELFEKRYFSDVLLRNETQFPEFLIRLNQWEPAAKWARVKVYTQLESPIKPAKSISLDKLLQNNTTTSSAELNAGNFSIESSTSLSQYKYQVVVQVTPGSDGIRPHHVRIVPTPPRVQRSYTLAGNGSREILSITHRFMYESKTDVESAEKPRIEIWTRDQLTTGAPSFTVDVQIPRW
ncbi:hypothetical protein GC197_15650 [bacterium]|nr:hypothetical protein [bacterium]